MRYRVAPHCAGVDGVGPGEVGEWSPAVVKGLVRAGHLVPVDQGEPEDVSSALRAFSREEADGSLRAQFDLSWREREESFARELASRDARITELEVELAQAKLDLEALTAPKGQG